MCKYHKGKTMSMSCDSFIVLSRIQFHFYVTFFLTIAKHCMMFFSLLSTHRTTRVFDSFQSLSIFFQLTCFVQCTDPLTLNTFCLAYPAYLWFAIYTETTLFVWTWTNVNVLCASSHALCFSCFASSAHIRRHDVRSQAFAIATAAAFALIHAILQSIVDLRSIEFHIFCSSAFESPVGSSSSSHPIDGLWDSQNVLVRVILRSEDCSSSHRFCAPMIS